MMDLDFYDGVFVFRDDGGSPFMAYIFTKKQENGSLMLNAITECILDNKKFKPGVIVFRTREQAEHPEILPV